MSLIKPLFDYSWMICTEIIKYRTPNKRKYSFSLRNFGEKAKTSCTTEFLAIQKIASKKALKPYGPTARLSDCSEAIQSLKSIFHLPKVLSSPTLLKRFSNGAKTEYTWNSVTQTHTVLPGVLRWMNVSFKLRWINWLIFLRLNLDNDLSAAALCSFTVCSL